MGISHLLRSRFDRIYHGRRASELVEEYGGHIRFCGAVFVGSLLTALAVFQLGWVASNDWSVLAIAFGGGVCVPVAIMYLWLPRHRFAEFWVATAAKESFAPWFFTLVVAVGAAVLVAGIVARFRS